MTSAATAAPTVAARVGTRPVWQAHALSMASGAVATLAHAPFFFVPAYVLAITLLVWLLDGAARTPRPLRAGFARAWWFGFGHFLTGLFWIGAAFTQVEGAGPLMLPAVLALPAGLALFWGAAGALALRFWTADWRRLAWFAGVVSLTELARGTVLTGFPWLLPGAIWPAGGAVSQVASVVGIYGLSALTLFAAATPAALGTGGSVGRNARPVLAAALGFGLIWGWGAERLAAHPPRAEGPIVRVADPGLTQKEKWSIPPEQVLIDYLSLSGDPESEEAIVVWPEGAVPLYADMPDLLRWEPALEAIGARLGDRVLIVGANRREARAGEPGYFNSALVLDSVAGRVRVSDVVDKHHLVPFGEYLPLWELYSAIPLAPLQQIGSGFIPGPEPGRVVIPGAPDAAILICYEAIFPWLPPTGEERPGWLVNISNDAWFGGLTGPWQHANQARYRAIEQGLPLVRAASGGVSGVFDPYGRALASTDLTGGAVTHALPNPLEPSLYARFGLGMSLSIIALLLLMRGIRLGQERHATRE